jgi:hypothetical protein
MNTVQRAANAPAAHIGEENFLPIKGQCFLTQ